MTACYPVREAGRRVPTKNRRERASQARLCRAHRRLSAWTLKCEGDILRSRVHTACCSLSLLRHTGSLRSHTLDLLCKAGFRRASRQQRGFIVPGRFQLSCNGRLDVSVPGSCHSFLREVFHTNRAFIYDRTTSQSLLCDRWHQAPTCCSTESSAPQPQPRPRYPPLESYASSHAAVVPLAIYCVPSRSPV